MTEQRTRIEFDLVASTELQHLLELALQEDLGDRGDVTSQALMPDADAAMVMVAREDFILSGLPVAMKVFEAVDPSLKLEPFLADSDQIEAGAEILRIRGAAGSILSAERTALNFLQRLSGIATQTGRYVAAVEEWGTQILDTRKTTPGWRLLEKYAVHCGGGVNHRAGLYDQVLIKDNHLAHWRRNGGSLAGAVAHARQEFPDLLVEVEADSVTQVKQLVEADPDWILLDNMTLFELESCVHLCEGRCKTEASGGITLDTLQGVAATGVDAISVGALTHSVRSVDIALDAI